MAALGEAMRGYREMLGCPALLSAAEAEAAAPPPDRAPRTCLSSAQAEHALRLGAVEHQVRLIMPRTGAVTEIPLPFSSIHLRFLG
jgi:hypothetical protein